MQEQSSYDMNGDVAIITGGAMGIGLACAARLHDYGSAVCLFDVNENALREAAASIGDGATRVFAYEVDVTDSASIDAAVASVMKQFGKVTQLLNSAGITGPNATIADYGDDDWRRVIEINLNGTFFVNRAVSVAMAEGGYGRIVNIASIAGKEGNPNAGAYSASKAGVIGLTKSLGKELAGTDIAVNCITPAAAKTRIFDQMTQEHIDYMLSKIPRGRFVQLDEIASMVCWLLSRENSFTTGAAFDLSGGRATY